MNATGTQPTFVVSAFDDTGPEEAGRDWPQELRNALNRDVGRERREHGREPSAADQEAVHQPDEERDAERAKNPKREQASALTLAGEEGEHDDNEAGERAHREVDPTRHQHDQLAERDEDERTREQQHGLEVVGAVEAAVRRRRIDPEPEDDRGQDHARHVVAGDEAAQPPDAPFALRRRGAAARRRGDRGAGDVLLRDLVALERADDLAAREDEHPVAQPLQLDRVRRENDDGLALVRCPSQHLVELHPGSGVDASGRFIGQQHRRLGKKRPGEEHFLLVAAGKGRRRRLEPRRPDRQPLDLAADGAPLEHALDEAEARKRREREERDVLADAEREQHPFGVAVSGQVDDARTARRTGIGDRDPCPVEQHLARRTTKAGEGTHHLALPIPLDPGEADDLAGLHGKIDVAKAVP